MTSSPEHAGWSAPSFDARGPAATVADPPGAWPPPELPGSRAQQPGPKVDPALESAYARGLAEGRAAGEAAVRLELGPPAAALAAAARELATRQEEFARDRTRNLHGLALVVAQKLLEQQVAASPTIIRDLVARALDLLPGDDLFAIRLNPADLQHARAELDGLAAAGRPLQLKWIADPELSRGSFLLETPLRLIDGRTDTALRQLYERLDDE